jgi:hypothetical protein
MVGGPENNCLEAYTTLTYLAAPTRSARRLTVRMQSRSCSSSRGRNGRVPGVISTRSSSIKRRGKMDLQIVRRLVLGTRALKASKSDGGGSHSYTHVRLPIWR